MYVWYMAWSTEPEEKVLERKREGVKSVFGSCWCLSDLIFISRQARLSLSNYLELNERQIAANSSFYNNELLSLSTLFFRNTRVSFNPLERQAEGRRKE